MTSEILLSSQNAHEPAASLFTRKELVGKGAYGGVYKGIHNATGLVVALKVIDLDTPDDDISEIQKEVALLSEMRDANKYNITLYHGCYLNGHELWIAMDFASGGSIRTLMKSGKIEEKYIVLILREVLIALSFLHRQGIIHRDVKAANILLTQAGKILLCDFGVAAHLQTNNKRSTFIGTPLWMAPEVITDGKLYDTKADVWSLGVTLYEIATGNPPYFGMEPLRACALIPRSAPAKLEGTVFSMAMKEFLSLCLQTDPEHRPSAEELSKTRWIKSASKLPMVLLRELIVRYLSWVQTGGQRASLAGIESLAREDTFEMEDEIWDFDINGDAPMVEPLGDEPPRSLDAMAAISSVRPPKIPVHSNNFSRNHPLLRLFDAASNPYANATPTSYNLPSGISSMETVRPMISIPSFEEMDEMAEAKTMKYTELPQELISPITIRPNPFSWTTQNRSASPLPMQNLDSPWDTSDSGTATPTDATYSEQHSFFPPVTSSPSLPSLMGADRPFTTRRRADTAPSSDYPSLGPGIPSPLPTPSHSSNTSISSSGSLVTSNSSGTSQSSYTTHEYSPPPLSIQRSHTPSARSRTGVDILDANRPFRERKGSDLRVATSIGVNETMGIAENGRPRTASDVRPSALHPKHNLKVRLPHASLDLLKLIRISVFLQLQIATGPTNSGPLHNNSNSTGSSSGSSGSNNFNYNLPALQTPLTAPTTFSNSTSRYGGGKTSFDSANSSPNYNLPTPLASAPGGSTSFPFPSSSTASSRITHHVHLPSTSSSASFERSESEPEKWPTGPPIRVLDYTKLGTASDVHRELERTIGELGEWLKVVDGGLERLIGSSVA